VPWFLCAQLGAVACHLQQTNAPALGCVDMPREKGVFRRLPSFFCCKNYLGLDFLATNA
jgi:hypothetical protein